jgi:hypothetical protein
MLVAFVSLRDFTLQLKDDHHPSEKYIPYITKASSHAPHLESITIYHGHNHAPHLKTVDGRNRAFRFKRVDANWVVCDEDE